MGNGVSGLNGETVRRSAAREHNGEYVAATTRNLSAAATTAQAQMHRAATVCATPRSSLQV